MDITDAFKSFRRNSYVYKSNWRAAVICANSDTFQFAWDIARLTTEASSMTIERAEHVRRVLTFSTGSEMRFFLAQGPLDVYEMAGMCFTHMILVGYNSPPAEEAYLRSMLRSPDIDSEKLLFQTGVFL